MTKKRSSLRIRCLRPDSKADCRTTNEFLGRCFTAASFYCRRRRATDHPQIRLMLWLLDVRRPWKKPKIAVAFSNAVCYNNSRDYAKRLLRVRIKHRRCVGIGRRGGLKILCQRWRVGSSPTTGTKKSCTQVRDFYFLLLTSSLLPKMAGFLGSNR